MYTDHYGLSGLPFQLTPDARFWYQSRTHKKAMAYLGYGIAQGEGFITITGEVGAGKSTLVAHLMETIDRSRLNAISIVSTQVQGDDMLRLAAQGLGLSTDGVEKAQLLERVEKRLEEEFRSGKRTLLIVDEAQNLPTSALEELRMLSNYQLGGRALVQIFLLGQPEFRDKLASPDLEQLRQRVIATHHLEAMDPDEIESYVLHRLAVVGADGRPAFGKDAFEAIHVETGGIPRRVNQLANRVLLYAAIDGAEEIDGDTVATVIADLKSDSLPARDERVLPLRTAAPAPSDGADWLDRRRQSDRRASPVADFAVERRVAALEAQLEQQEAALRHVLTLLVEWVENGTEQQPSYRTNAA